MIVGVAMGRSLTTGWSGSNCGKHSTSVTVDTDPGSHLAEGSCDDVSALVAAAAVVGGGSVDAAAVAPPQLPVLETGEGGDNSNWSPVSRE